MVLGTGSFFVLVGALYGSPPLVALGGTVVFALVMLTIFEALFTWSEPFIGWIETGVGVTQGAVWGAMSEGPLRELLVHGVIAGVGNVVVFVPQIAILFLLITFLEDSGYLARVAFVIDRPMKAVGLHGKAFVPLLSGFACAVPGIMAARWQFGIGLAMGWVREW